MKINTRMFCLVALAVPAVASSARAATINPFANGDFETGVLAPWTTTPGANGDQIVIVPVSLLSVLGAGSPAANGNYAVDFNGGNVPAGGTLSQTFTTTAGTAYSVSFQYGATAGGTQKLDASVLGVGGSSDVLSTAAATAVNPPSALATHTFQFVADGTSATISFLDDPTNSTLGQDGVLDNVSVTAVPEPAAAGLLAIGASGLLATRRASKSKRS